MIRVRLRVKEVATDRDMKRAKLSRLADVSPGTLERIWKDPHHEVYLSTLARLAHALHVPVEMLYAIEHDALEQGDDA